eukprot:gene2391-7812_t
MAGTPPIGERRRGRASPPPPSPPFAAASDAAAGGAAPPSLVGAVSSGTDAAAGAPKRSSGGQKARDGALADGGGAPPARRRAVEAAPERWDGKFPERPKEGPRGLGSKRVLGLWMSRAGRWFRRVDAEFRPHDYEKRPQWFWTKKISGARLADHVRAWADHHEGLPEGVRGQSFAHLAGSSSQSSDADAEPDPDLAVGGLASPGGALGRGPPPPPAGRPAAAPRRAAPQPARGAPARVVDELSRKVEWLHGSMEAMRAELRDAAEVARMLRRPAPGGAAPHPPPGYTEEQWHELAKTWGNARPESAMAS